MSFTVHKDVMVAMRDGVELATDLWVPDTTPAPTLLVRLPYSKTSSVGAGVASGTHRSVASSTPSRMATMTSLCTVNDTPTPSPG